MTYEEDEYWIPRAAVIDPLISEEWDRRLEQIAARRWASRMYAGTNERNHDPCSRRLQSAPSSR
jgi:hypothetical protein